MCQDVNNPRPQVIFFTADAVEEVKNVYDKLTMGYFIKVIPRRVTMSRTSRDVPPIKKKIE